MALARYTRNLQDERGRKVVGATVTVRRESDNGLASIYSDTEGANALDNPLTLAADSYTIDFCVVGSEGGYSVSVVKGSLSQTFHNVPIGTAAQFDADSFSGGGGGDVTASSTTTFTNKSIDANGTGNSITNLEVADFAASAIVVESEGIGSNDNDTTLPTSAAVKDYADTKQTASSALTSIAGAWTPASASGAASLDFLEDTDNGTNRVRLQGPASTGDVTVTLPAATDTLVGKATTDTLTNKTFDANGTGNAISNLEVADFAASAITSAADTIAGNDSDSQVPTTAAVIDYAQPLNANLSSWDDVTRASGFDTFAATPTSANLRSLLSDESGTGAALFAGGAIGTPSSGTLTNCTGLPTVVVANEATDTTCFMGFFTAASGELGPKTNANATFNSNTGVVTFASAVLTTADINGGTIDAATIGASSATTGKFSTVETTGGIELGNASDTTLARESAGRMTIENFSVPRILSVQNGGDTNNSSSGSGSYFVHNLNYTTAASFLGSGKALRIFAAFRLTTGSAAPNFLYELRAGSTVLVEVQAQGLTNNVSNNTHGVSFIVQATAAAGASVACECAISGQHTVSGGTNNSNVTDQPVNLATNGTLQWQIATQFATAGTGTNTVTLSQFIVEALN